MSERLRIIPVDFAARGPQTAISVDIPVGAATTGGIPVGVSFAPSPLDSNQRIPVTINGVVRVSPAPSVSVEVKGV